MEVFWYEILGILIKLGVDKGQTHPRKLGSMFSIISAQVISRVCSCIWFWC